MDIKSQRSIRKVSPTTWKSLKTIVHLKAKSLMKLICIKSERRLAGHLAPRLVASKKHPMQGENLIPEELMAIYIVDIEAVDTSYTKQWKEYLPNPTQRATNEEVKVISGGDIPATIIGAFYWRNKCI